MPDSTLGQGDATLWWIVLIAVILLAAVMLFFWMKGRRMAGAHVFRASRFSRGNFLFPTQVAVNPASIVHFTPELFGGREQSIHMAHVSSVLIDRNLFFSNVMIETSGGASPVRCHGHNKRDASEMKRLVEEFQSAYYRDRQTTAKTDPA
ncbi:MAG: hypothetical protein ABIS06_18000 [Vicinamibacterales bacterium]